MDGHSYYYLIIDDSPCTHTLNIRTIVDVLSIVDGGEVYLPVDLVHSGIGDASTIPHV